MKDVRGFVDQMQGKIELDENHLSEESLEGTSNVTSSIAGIHAIRYQRFIREMMSLKDINLESI